MSLISLFLLDTLPGRFAPVCHFTEESIPSAYVSRVGFCLAHLHHPSSTADAPLCSLQLPDRNHPVMTSISCPCSQWRVAQGYGDEIVVKDFGGWTFSNRNIFPSALPLILLARYWTTSKSWYQAGTKACITRICAMAHRGGYPTIALQRWTFALAVSRASTFLNHKQRKRKPWCSAVPRKRVQSKE